MYFLRAIGGTIYLTGAILMVYNLYKTAKQGVLTRDEVASAPALEVVVGEKINHRWLEGKAVLFFALTVIAVVIGGLVELAPSILSEVYSPTKPLVKPYTALEQEGRDIYIKEGCSSCHSQSIRPFKNETMRYGDFSKAGDYVYDHPFLWGSKRTGPDLLREGGKRSNAWHYNHMKDPEMVTPNSIMPKYEWLFQKKIDVEMVQRKMKALRKIGVPYSEEEIANYLPSLKLQAQAIIDDLVKSESKPKELYAEWDDEIVALIAYLQILGKRIENVDSEKEVEK
jgi:cytochrome c oxidase cbb3-type subunit I/II